jgi:NTP pyrophosphatase (non-canonical NTP hydrolase)
MTLKESQEKVDKWAKQFDPPYWTPHQIMTRLVEEVGELAREVNHVHGPKKKKAGEKEGSIGDEISDVIFTLICLANKEGIDLDQYFNTLIDEKCYIRDNDRYKKI